MSIRDITREEERKRVMKTLQKDQETIAELSQVLNALAKEGKLWTISASYNRGEKLPLTESGKSTVTSLYRFLMEYGLEPLSIVSDASCATIEVQILAISSSELDNLFTAVRGWKEKHMSRRRRVASLKFRLSISGNEDSPSASRIRSF